MSNDVVREECVGYNVDSVLNLNNILNSGAKEIRIKPKADSLEIKIIKEKSVTKATQHTNGLIKQETIASEDAQGCRLTEQIVFLYTTEKKTQVEIAEILSIPQSKVSRILQSQGFSRGIRCSNFIEM